MGISQFRPTTPFVDAKGVLTREGYALLRSLVDQSGGASGMGSDDLAALASSTESALEIRVAELTKEVTYLREMLDMPSPPRPSQIEDLKVMIEMVPNYGAALAKLGTMAKQNADAVAITGGNINGTAIGGSVRSTGRFTNIGVGTGAPLYRFVVSNNGNQGVEIDSDGSAYGAGTTGIVVYDRTAAAYVPFHVSASTISLRASNVTKFSINSTGIGFYATAPVAKPTIVGSRAGNPAVASIASVLNALGLATDSTTA